MQIFLVLYTLVHEESSIGRYQVLSQLGEGGMGRVYKARDPLLNRFVALKVLLPGMADPEQRARFLQEARAASALNHPNIITIYEVGEVGGQDYIAMEFLDGQPLDRLIPATGLPTGELVAYAQQMAGALELAEAAQVVHRDLKPANVFVTSSGRIKVLDFGLAKITFAAGGPDDVTRSVVAATPHTQAGVLLGTVAYMSPEQAEGRAVDARSDIFSFGCILYEMVTGRRAFQGSSLVAVLSSVLRDDPLPVEGPLAEVITRCLRKAPGQRYQSFREVSEALQSKGSGSGVISTSGIALVEPAVPSMPGSSHAVPSLAVLPFADMSPQRDQEYFCDGIAEEIINSLTRLKNVRIAARTSAFSFKGRQEDIREIGRKLNVGLVVEGSVRTAGQRLRVTAQLIDVADGHQLWSERYDREMADVFAIQDDIAAAVFEALRARFDAQRVSHGARRYTDNIEAYSLYLQGRHAWNQWEPQSFQAAEQLFKQALELDSTYAPAWCGLADTYSVIASFGIFPPRLIYPQAREAADRALALDPNLAEAWTSLGVTEALYDWNWADAEKHLRHAIELRPGWTVAHQALGLCVMTPQRRFAEAAECLHRALDQDPFSPSLLQSAFYAAMLTPDPARAKAVCGQMEALFPRTISTHFARMNLALMEQRWDDTVDLADLFEKVSPGEPYPLIMRAQALAGAGRHREAWQQVAQVDQIAQGRCIQQSDLAGVLLALGDQEAAYQRLERAVENRESPFFLVDPRFSTIAQEPRFVALVARAGAAGAAATSS
ncbi:MAG: protein kinase [Acidobacteria bacterium]|nr:protein kinase [Acidobacteriota bacterium]